MNTTMSHPTLTRHWSAWLPIALSVAALAVLAVHVGLHGSAPQADEGAAAHLWQLLMLLQAPVVLWFATQWLPRHPRPASAVLALQGLAALLAVWPVAHWGL